MAHKTFFSLGHEWNALQLNRISCDHDRFMLNITEKSLPKALKGMIKANAMALLALINYYS